MEGAAKRSPAAQSYGRSINQSHNQVLNSLLELRNRSMWVSETKKKGHSLREWYRFCICSNSSWFHLQSVWARGKRFFCSHHSTGGNETTSAADWNGLGCKWLRFCTLIRTPGASDYLQVGAAMTVIHGLITAGLSRSPPQSEKQTTSQSEKWTPCSVKERNVCCFSLHNPLTWEQESKEINFKAQRDWISRPWHSPKTTYVKFV